MKQIILTLIALSRPEKLFAHSEAVDYTEVVDSLPIDEAIASLSLKGVGFASLALLVLIALAVLIKNHTTWSKRILFSLITIIVVGTTAGLAGSTIYLNKISATKGPVHWHADIEVWACDEKLEFVDPVGRFSNKIGTNTYHEHNDERLHVEGVVVNESDVSLGKFFDHIGGYFSMESASENPELDYTSALIVPTNEGERSFYDNAPCVEGNGSDKLQTFVYQTNDDDTFTQKKIQFGDDYVMSPYSQVPKGDCIVIEFGPVKEKTDHMCKSYTVAQEIGKLKGEASGN